MDKLSIQRRTVMKGVGAGILGSLLPESVAKAAEPNTVTVLGDFEGSLNHWKTNGGNTLGRHTDDEWDRPITSGEGALEVQANGDPYPMAYNRKRVRNADLIETPYLLADVTIGQFEDESTDLMFRFRYHHSSEQAANDKESGNGNNGRRKRIDSSRNGSKPGQSQSPLVETSESISLPQYINTTLTWDLSGLSKAKRRKPERIDVAWHAAGKEPKKGPSGRGPGKNLIGSVYFDNIRLVDSLTALSEQAIARHLTRLKAKHGTLEYENESADIESLTERGRFIFHDGTEVRVEFVADTLNRWRYTIGEETYRLGGGWE